MWRTEIKRETGNENKGLKREIKTEWRRAGDGE